jgi:hypothetical protein
MTYDINYVAPLIRDYVEDHKKYFDAWPVDIEVDNHLFEWNEYWLILETYKTMQDIKESEK